MSCALQKVSQEEDREALSTALAAAEDWLYDEGESTTLAAYKAKLAELKAVADVIFVPLNVYRNPTPVATPPPTNETDTTASNSTDASPEPAVDETEVGCAVLEAGGVIAVVTRVDSRCMLMSRRCVLLLCFAPCVFCLVVVL